jgi:D-alanyl-D-alanine carboxypeptidase
LLALLSAVLILCPRQPVLAQNTVPEAYHLPPRSYVQQLADGLSQATGTPGLVLGLGAGNGAEVLAASGVEYTPGGPPVAPEEQFPAASITKLFTATIVLQLAEEGKLSLDDPLSRYVPSFSGADGITLRMLLAHRSGISDYLDLGINPLLAPLISLETYTPQEIIDYFSCRPLLSTPGTSFHYSNINFILLGMVIEKAGQESYGSQLHRRLLGPLGMDHTLLAGYDPLPDSALRGYADLGHGLRDCTAMENPSLSWSAGAIVSNTSDLLRFVNALLSGQVLQPESLAAMMTFQETGNGTQYGLGMASYELPGGRVYGHTGETLSFSSALYYQPATGRSFALLANLAHVSSRRVLEYLQDYFAGDGQTAGGG